jgi:hypothetical protein
VTSFYDNDKDLEQPLESGVEGPAVTYAELRGWWVAKFVSPGKRGVPDRLFIRNGRHLFIEFKRPGKDARKQQEKRHREMREHGAEVHVVDNLEQAYALLR